MAKNKKSLRFRPQRFINETQEVRKFAAQYPNYSFSPHAREQKAARGLDDLDILRVISKGRVMDYKPEPTGDWRYTIRGSTVDREIISIVLKLDWKRQKIKIVTLWRN